MTSLTKEQALKYFSQKGACCPFCDSSELVRTNHINFDSDTASKTIVCDACREEWTDQYHLSSIIHDGTRFANENLVKTFVQSEFIDYGSLAQKFTERNGWNLIKTIKNYAVSKVHDNEYAVHTITQTCLEYGHYGFDTQEGAIEFLLSRLFSEDIEGADCITINDGPLLSSWFMDEDLLSTSYDNEDGRYEFNYNLQCLKSISNLGLGKWKVEEDIIQCLKIAPYSASKEGLCD